VEKALRCGDDFFEARAVEGGDALEGMDAGDEAGF
jgi:hypothetical protein